MPEKAKSIKKSRLDQSNLANTYTMTQQKEEDPVQKDVVTYFNLKASYQ